MGIQTLQQCDFGPTTFVLTSIAYQWSHNVVAKVAQVFRGMPLINLIIILEDHIQLNLPNNLQIHNNNLTINLECNYS